jgi:hypothetical protein
MKYIHIDQNLPCPSTKIKSIIVFALLIALSLFCYAPQAQADTEIWGDNEPATGPNVDPSGDRYDVVLNLAKLESPGSTTTARSIAYTYSEPITFFEYMLTIKRMEMRRMVIIEKHLNHNPIKSGNFRNTPPFFVYCIMSPNYF